MKRLLPAALLMMLSAWLVGCAYTQSPFLNTDLVKETWQADIDTNPTKWTQGADRWFLTGDPNRTEIANRRAPFKDVVSTMQVRVPDFTNIVSNGSYQLQVFGTYAGNSVYVYGENQDVRETVVNVRGNTLYLNQTKDAKSTMRHVIIRVGVGTLTKLKQEGEGSVEVIQLPSSHLTVSSSGKGDVFISGNVDLRRVDVTGKGSVSVFGAKTPVLDITSSGLGSVNVSGMVGIHNIVHHGRGDVNIIGANSDSLKINADGAGKIGISGIVNLTEVQARDTVSVLVNCVNGESLYVYSMEKARVGLAGNVKDLSIYAAGISKVWARFLFSQNAYTRAQDGSHVNVAATNKIYASATRNGSVYFFGEPKIMSQFVSGNGVVVPIWTGTASHYRRSRPTMVRPIYKDEMPESFNAGSRAVSYKTSPQYKWVKGKLVTSN